MCTVGPSNRNRALFIITNRGFFFFHKILFDNWLVIISRLKKLQCLRTCLVVSSGLIVNKKKKKTQRKTDGEVQGCFSARQVKSFAQSTSSIVLDSYENRTTEKIGLSFSTSFTRSAVKIPSALRSINFFYE